MPKQTRELQLASLGAWLSTLVTSWIYFTRFPTPFTSASILENTYSTRYGFIFNGVLSVIIGATLYRSRNTGGRLRWIMIHFFTGLILIFLAFTLSPQPQSVLI